MASYWRDMESIHGFAGSEPHIAVTYPEDDEYGLISDPFALHFEVREVPEEFPLYLKKGGIENGEMGIQNA